MFVIESRLPDPTWHTNPSFYGVSFTWYFVLPNTITNAAAELWWGYKNVREVCQANQDTRQELLQGWGCDPQFRLWERLVLCAVFICETTYRDKSLYV
jgi:hypothetical protein